MAFLRIQLVEGLALHLVALVGVWWLERKTDAYVRRRESARD